MSWFLILPVKCSFTVLCQTKEFQKEMMCEEMSLYFRVIIISHVLQQTDHYKARMVPIMFQKTFMWSDSYLNGDGIDDNDKIRAL
jgi:hypothetical protein